jgi:hypothetical protein
LEEAVKTKKPLTQVSPASEARHSVAMRARSIIR